MNRVLQMAVPLSIALCLAGCGAAGGDSADDNVESTSQAWKFGNWRIGEIARYPDGTVVPSNLIAVEEDCSSGTCVAVASHEAQAAENQLYSWGLPVRVADDGKQGIGCGQATGLVRYKMHPDDDWSTTRPRVNFFQTHFYIYETNRAAGGPYQMIEMWKEVTSRGHNTWRAMLQNGSRRYLAYYFKSQMSGEPY